MCEYCTAWCHELIVDTGTLSANVTTGAELYVEFHGKADQEYDMAPINYCPMCGRDLRGGANEDGHVTLPHDLAHMALCGAVRWYVGRGTVASREVADGVRELLPQLGAGTKAVMARDIRRELETYGATPGPIDDMAPWRTLLEAIEEQPC